MDSSHGKTKVVRIGILRTIEINWWEQIVESDDFTNLRKQQVVL